MRVFKPTEVTDSNFTSTIPAPDPDYDPDVWKNPFDPLIVAGERSAEAGSLVNGEYWIAGATDNEDGDYFVGRYSTDFSAVSFINVGPRSIDGIAYDEPNNAAYFLRDDDVIEEYDATTGVTTGNTFTLTLNPTAYTDVYSIAWANGSIGVFANTASGKVITEHNTLGEYIENTEIADLTATEGLGSGDIDYYDGSFLLTSNNGKSLISVSQTEQAITNEFRYLNDRNPDVSALMISPEGQIVSYVAGPNDFEFSVYYLDPESLTPSYYIGALVAYNNLVYEAVAVSSDSPDVGAAADTPTWVEIGTINKFAMFDGNIGNKSYSAGDIATDPEISVTFTTVAGGDYITAVAGFGIEGALQVVIEVEKDAQTLYSETIQMRDNTAVVGWYEYLFSPLVAKDRFARFDLPPVSDADVIVTTTGAMAEGAEVAIGELVFGSQLYLGVTQYGSSYQLLDFSRTERDDFGNVSIIRRGTADLMTFDVKITEASFASVRQTLESLRVTPSVWLGSDTDAAYAVYGIYKDLVINWSSPSLYDCSFQVEGLT